MANIKRKDLQKVQSSARTMGMQGTSRAARQYIASGLKNLNLTRRQEMDLKIKLQPLIEKQMKTERTRTLTRAEGITTREEKKKMSKAQKKIMGGK